MRRDVAPFGAGERQKLEDVSKFALLVCKPVKGQQGRVADKAAPQSKRQKGRIAVKAAPPA
jgi:hypothetical protein